MLSHIDTLSRYDRLMRASGAMPDEREEALFSLAAQMQPELQSDALHEITQSLLRPIAASAANGISPAGQLV